MLTRLRRAQAAAAGGLPGAASLDAPRVSPASSSRASAHYLEQLDRYNPVAPAAGADEEQCPPFPDSSSALEPVGLEQLYDEAHAFRGMAAASLGNLVSDAFAWVPLFCATLCLSSALSRAPAAASFLAAGVQPAGTVYELLDDALEATLERLLPSLEERLRQHMEQGLRGALLDRIELLFPGVLDAAPVGGAPVAAARSPPSGSSPHAQAAAAGEALPSSNGHAEAGSGGGGDIDDEWRSSPYASGDDAGEGDASSAGGGAGANPSRATAAAAAAAAAPLRQFDGCESMYSVGSGGVDAPVGPPWHADDEPLDDEAADGVGYEVGYSYSEAVVAPLVANSYRNYAAAAASPHAYHAGASAGSPWPHAGASAGSFAYGSATATAQYGSAAAAAQHGSAHGSAYVTAAATQYGSAAPSSSYAHHAGAPASSNFALLSKKARKKANKALRLAAASGGRGPAISHGPQPLSKGAKKRARKEARQEGLRRAEEQARAAKAARLAAGRARHAEEVARAKNAKAAKKAAKEARAALAAELARQARAAKTAANRAHEPEGARVSQPVAAAAPLPGHAAAAAAWPPHTQVWMHGGRMWG